MDLDIIKILFYLTGGLGIFLLGMKNVSEGTQAVAGRRLRALINTVTHNRFVACGVGTLVTSVIQSSSVTTVIVVGMVSAGVMTLFQAIGVIIGANIGTTITAWIIALPIGNWGLPILGVSALFYLFCKNDTLRYTATATLGLGMIFFGLEVMSQGLSPLKDTPAFSTWFSKFTPIVNGEFSYWGLWKCILAGAILTGIIQSSSATIGITQALAAMGLISLPTAIGLVLGENIGTTITAQLAAIGTTTSAKRAAWSHTLFNVIGVIWISSIFPFYMKFLDGIIGYDPFTAVIGSGEAAFPHIRQNIALAHSCFNIVNVLVFLPFLRPFSKLVEKLVPTKKIEESPHLRYLDVRMLKTPALGIQQSGNEILRMAVRTESMLDSVRRIFEDANHARSEEEKVFNDEMTQDVAQKEIIEYLSQLLSGEVPHDVMDTGRRQLRMADEYESVADYITAILKLKLKLRDSKLEITPTGMQEILDLHDHVMAYLRMVNDAVRREESGIIPLAAQNGHAITHLMKEYRAHHLSRVEQGQATPLKSLIYTDMLNDYRRIKDHTLNIAEVLGGEK